MTEEYDELRVRPVDSARAIEQRIAVSNRRQREGQREQSDERDEARRHFAELTKAAELAHEVLVREKSPYRFCIYREAGEVFIDVVVLDANGAVAQTIRKNIGHEDFLTCIRRIEEESGLFFDGSI